MAHSWLQGLVVVGFGFLLAVPGAVAQTDRQGTYPEAGERQAPPPPGPYRSGSSDENEVWNKRSRGGYPYQQMQQRRLGYPQGSRGGGGMNMGVQMGNSARGGSGYGDNVPPPPPSGAPQQGTTSGADSGAQDRQSRGFGGNGASQSRRGVQGKRYKGDNRQGYRGERKRGQRSQQRFQGGEGTQGGRRGTSNRDRYRSGGDQAGRGRRQPQYGPSYGRQKAPEYPPDQQRPERGGQRQR